MMMIWVTTGLDITIVTDFGQRLNFVGYTSVYWLAICHRHKSASCVVGFAANYQISIGKANPIELSLCILSDSCV